MTMKEIPNTLAASGIAMLPAVLGSLLFTTLLAAQTDTLRGKIEDVPGTTNQFVLDGTNMPLFSSALNLKLWVGQNAIMQVVNVGTATVPVIRIDSAVPTKQVMDMGNLRIGQTSNQEVLAPAGSAAFIFLDFASNTGFLPFGGFGVWLLGTSPHLFAGGITNALNSFQAPFAVPANRALIGMELTSQAFVGDHGNWFFSNLDYETIQP
jgi:hypothetical protein